LCTFNVLKHFSSWNSINRFFILFFLLFALINFSNVFSQKNYYNPLTNAVCLNPEPSRLKADRHLWVEDESKRSWFSSTYKKPDGKIVIEYSKLPINYMSANKKLEPINLIPIKTPEGDLLASRQICPVKIHKRWFCYYKDINFKWNYI